MSGFTATDALEAIRSILVELAQECKSVDGDVVGYTVLLDPHTFSEIMDLIDK